MTLPKRFSLSALLLLMVVVAIIFGFSQWRKRNLLSQVAELNVKNDFLIEVSDDWFWPEVLTQRVMVTYGRDDQGRYFNSSRTESLSKTEMTTRYRALVSELNSIGVSDISIAMRIKIGPSHHTWTEFSGIEKFEASLEE